MQNATDKQSGLTTFHQQNLWWKFCTERWWHCSIVVCGIIFKVLSSHAGQPLLENFQTTKIFTQSLYRILNNKNKKRNANTFTFTSGTRQCIFYVNFNPCLILLRLRNPFIFFSLCKSVKNFPLTLMEKLLSLYKLSPVSIIHKSRQEQFVRNIRWVFVKWNDNKNLVKMKSTYFYHIILMFISTK